MYRAAATALQVVFFCSWAMTVTALPVLVFAVAAGPAFGPAWLVWMAVFWILLMIAIAAASHRFFGLSN